MPNSEAIMRNKAETYNGWTKINSPFNGRMIKIGNIRNCNDDSLVKNLQIKESIINVLKKYDIKDYELYSVDNENEYSVDLRLKENIYNHFKNHMNKVK